MKILHSIVTYLYAKIMISIVNFNTIFFVRIGGTVLQAHNVYLDLSCSLLIQVAEKSNACVRNGYSCTRWMWKSWCHISAFSYRICIYWSFQFHLIRCMHLCVCVCNVYPSTSIYGHICVSYTNSHILLNTLLFDIA